MDSEPAICRRLNDLAGLTNSLAHQAWLLAFELSRPEDSLTLAEEAARIAAKHGLRALAQQIGPRTSDSVGCGGDDSSCRHRPSCRHDPS
jgi:hypothetical protein